MIRQLLTESILLASLGGVAGILFAHWGIRFLATVVAPQNEAVALRPELNLPVLAAASFLTMITGLLFGLAPALQATRVDPMPVLKENRVAGENSHRRLRFSLSGMLVISQMAICLLLLVGAGLFVRTLSNLRSLTVGFERDNVLLFKLNARQAGHRDAEMLSFYRDMEGRLGSIPGVRAVSMANSPLIGNGAWFWPVLPAGKPKPDHAPSGHGTGADEKATRTLAVAPGFFASMHIPLLAGREFNQHDLPGAPLAVIVNEQWAKVNSEGRSPIGQRVTSFGFGKPQEMEIVGVVRNSRYDGLTDRFPAVAYVAFGQSPDVPADEMTFFLRTAGNPVAYAGAVREIVRQADARIPVAGLSTQTAQIEGEMANERLFARLCTVFALLSLAIACVGLYGTTSYTVARRTGEIGIRMALGAQRRTVVRMVLRDVLVLATVGLAVSLPASFAASKLVESLLFGVKPGDPWAIAGAAAVLLGAALAAGYLPARRASRIDPMAALRHE